MTLRQGEVVVRWVRRLLLGDEWVEAPRADDVDPRIMARLSANVAVAIAALFAVVLTLPAADGERAVLTIATLIPAAAALLYARYGERLSFRLSDVLSVCAGATLVALMADGGPVTPAIPSVYLLIGTSMMAMRRPVNAVASVSMLLTTYAVGLALGEVDQPLVRWVAVAGAVVSCGTFVRLLMSVVLSMTVSERAERATIEQLSVELQQASEEKSRFLARMSHELRTPLNAVIGFGDVLHGGYGGPMTDRQLDYVADIGDSGRHLLGLVDDVLDLTHVESGTVELHRSTVDTAQLVRDCVAVVRPLAERHRVMIRNRFPADATVISVDERRLTQVVLNLLANAVRFAGENGTVELSGEVADDVLRVRISDSGPGVAPEDRERIFEPYEQAAGVVDGTGLGLPLARRLVEAHGGTLWLDAAASSGATFAFEVPSTCGDVVPQDDRGISTRSARPLYRAFTEPGSAASQQVIARAGTWFAVCSAGVAIAIALVADGPLGWRLLAVSMSCAAIAAALVLSDWSPNPSVGRLDATGTFGAVAISAICLVAGDFVDIAILPFSWLAMTGWAMWQGMRAFHNMFVVAALFTVVLVLRPSDRLAGVQAATVLFLLLGSALVVHVLISELVRSLSEEGRARSEAERVRRQLEAADRHKSEFLASMSHELRTPLNAVIGFADVLLRGYAGDLDDRQRRYVLDIRDAGVHLLDLINDILELAKLEASGDEAGDVAVSLRALVDDVAATLRPLAATRCVHIDVDGRSSAVVRGDSHRLALAVEKLIANAVKFSGDGSVVEVTVCSDEHRHILEITDHGVGISADQVPLVFDPFHQGTEPVPDHARGGTGLGLSLARGIIDVHGGTVGFRSEVGRGTTVTASFPHTRGVSADDVAMGAVE